MPLFEIDASGELVPFRRLRGGENLKEFTGSEVPAIVNPSPRLILLAGAFHVRTRAAIDFLIDNEIVFDLPALKSTSTRFESPLAAAKRALKSEKDVAGQFDRMASVAAAAGDHRGFQFLQWFIEEQVEEEAKLQSIVDLLASGINLFQAESLLDRFE